MIEVIQINLHRSETATNALMDIINKGKTHIALIQEPWTIRNKVTGLNHVNYQLFYANTGSRPRTCIICHKNLCYLLSPELSTSDATVLKQGNGNVYLASVYLPFDSPTLPPSSELQRLVREAKQRGNEVLVGCDANSHHITWGSTNINKRGQALVEYLNTNDLITLNIGNKATFVNKIREEVLDITICSENLINDVHEWRVSSEHSFSDHRYIRFKIARPPPNPISFRNKTKTKWTKYGRLIRERLWQRTYECHSEEDIDNNVENITDILVKSFEDCCPLRERKSAQEKPWVTGEIRQVGKEVRRLYNRASRKKSQVYWDDYHRRLSEYNKITRTAKRNSWMLFCEQVDGVNDVSKIKKFLSKTHTQTETMVDGMGERIETTEEAVRLLMNTHFPPGATERVEIPTQGENEGNEVYTITDDMVKEAIKSFAPYKAAGPDGIFPALLQMEVNQISTHLAGIFTACLKFAYTPKAWQEARVVFIPKPGKASYATPKAYRPISLTSFLLKTMERIVDTMIKSRIPSERLKFKQHAYVKGRSVDTALHEVVHNIEESFDKKMYTLAVCIDIEGAFNNVRIDTLIQSLDQFQVDRALRDWINHMLRNRWINCGSHNVNIRDRVAQGTPQGGILSPLLWVTTINSLLRILTEEGLRPVCYADDVIILLRGKNPNQLCRDAERALEIAYDWAQPRGLNVNPEKTEVCLFTRKTKIGQYVKPHFLGKAIDISDKIKYLGVILDRKLKWKDHIEERANKAHRCWSMCRRAIGSNWGLNPMMAHWLYKSVIRPVLTYGSVVWWTSMEKKCNIITLQKVQRTCCLGISGAMRTTSSRALETILDIRPIEIQIKYEAALTANRLKVMGEWINRDHRSYHQKIIEGTIGYPTEVSDRIPDTTIATNCEALIPDRQSWIDGTLAQMPSGTCCYTDGSKLGEKTGLGFFIEEPETEFSFRLPDHNTVFQAEVRAITECISWFSANARPTNVNIFTDSQMTINAITSKTVKSRTVLDCKNAINSYSECGKVRIIWVPGHHGVRGNERANALAIRARELHEINLDNAKPFGATRSELRTWAIDAHNTLWNSGVVGETTKILWGNPNGDKTKTLLKLSKKDINKIIGILTGHTGLRAHLHRIGAVDNSVCRACGEDDESLEHFLCHCPAFANNRSQFLGNDTLPNLTQIRGIDWKILKDYVNSTEFL